MPINFCQGGSVWGDVATWLAAAATLSAAIVALRTSSRSLGEARRLHRETLDLHLANEAKADRERDLNSVAVALICHQGLIELGAATENLSDLMTRWPDDESVLNAFHSYFRPPGPMDAVSRLGDKLFTLPPDVVAAVAVVMANNHSMERVELNKLETAEARRPHVTLLARELAAMVVNIKHALDAVTPIAQRSRPAISARWIVKH